MEELIKALLSFLKEGADPKAVAEAIKPVYEQNVRSQTSNLAKERDDFKTAKEKMAVEFADMSERFKGFMDTDVNYESYEKLVADYEALKTASSGKDSAAALDEMYKKGKDAQAKAVEPQMKKLQDQIASLADTSSSFKDRYIKMNARDTMVKAIQKMGIEPDEFALDGLMARLGTEYNDVEDKFRYIMKHDGNEIPLDDFIVQFPSTPAGKKMTPARMNTGGGATGSGASSNSKYTLEDLKKFKPGSVEGIEAMRELGFNV